MLFVLFNTLKKSIFEEFFKSRNPWIQDWLKWPGFWVSGSWDCSH